MTISARLFWFIIFVVVVIILIGGWALFLRPKQLLPHERGRKVTDPGNSNVGTPRVGVFPEATPETFCTVKVC